MNLGGAVTESVMSALPTNVPEELWPGFVFVQLAFIPYCKDRLFRFASKPASSTVSVLQYLSIRRLGIATDL